MIPPIVLMLVIGFILLAMLVVLVEFTVKIVLYVKTLNLLLNSFLAINQLL